MNSRGRARHWVQVLAARPEIPFADRLLMHFEAGKITRVCACGCNSFDLDIPATASLLPICPAGRFRMFFEIHFEAIHVEATAEALIAVLFFADARGYLAGIDVTLGDGNHEPMPNLVSLGRVSWKHAEV